MKHWRWMWMYILAALLAAGCTGKPTASPTPAVTPPELASTFTPTNPIPAAPSPVKSSPTATPTAELTATPTATQTPEGVLALAHSLAYQPWELVHAIHWSPDGKWLAVAAGEAVYLYDGLSLQELGRLDVGDWANAVDFSPIGDEGRAILALAASNGNVQLWELPGMQAAPKAVADFPAHHKGANSVSFSPDGKILASAGNDALVKLWDLQGFWADPTGEIPLLAAMVGGAFAVSDVDFSPDGLLVASVDQQSIRLRDPATQRLVRTLREEAAIFGFQFSPDGQYLALAKGQASVAVWEVESGMAVASWQAAENSPAFQWDVAFNTTGSLVGSVNSRGWLTLWRFPSGEAAANFQAHSRAASALAFSPDGRWLATGGLDAVLRIWELPADED